MSNGSNVNYSDSINSLMTTAGTLVQKQIEMLNGGLKVASQAIEPLGKTVTELTANVVGMCNQVLQNVSSALAPKK